MNARQGEERGRGIPRSEDERRRRHEELYPGTPLPERGTGLSGISDSSAAPWVVGGLAVLGLLLLATYKK